MTVTQTIGPLERALWLRGVPPFKGLRARLLAALAQLMGEETVAAGGAVHPDRGVRLLVEGRLATGGGALLEAPQVIGLIELLAGRERRDHLRADSDATFLTLDAGALLDLLEEELALVVALRQALGHGIAAAQQARGDWVPEAAVPPAAGPSADLDRFVDRMLILHRAPLLRAFGVAVLAALLRDEPARRVAAGEALFAAGDAAERILVVADGVVALTAPDGGVVRVGPGSLLGENEALVGLPHACAAACETAAALIALDAREIWDAAEDHFHVARALLAAGARQLLRLGGDFAAAPEPAPAAPPQAAVEVLC